MPWFLLYQFFAHGKRGIFESIVNRVSIGHLTREKLINVFFTVPPLKEQLLLLEEIEKRIKPTNIGMESLLKEIQIISEYRNRLISDAVTGQIDVRDWRSTEPISEEEESIQLLVDNEEGDEIGEDDADDQYQ